MTDAPATTYDAPRGRLVPRASLVLLLVALVPFLLTNLPLDAWFVATGIWIAGAVLHAWTRSLAAKTSPNAAIGLAAVGMFARMGIALAVLLYVGVSVDVGETTLGAGAPDVAAVALVLYTIVFTLDMGERIGVDASARTAAAATRKEDE